MVNELTKNNIIEDLNGKLNSYFNMKDLVLENDYIELLGDLSKVFGLLRNASNLIAQKRFIAFLKGFQNGEKPTEEQLIKLMEYIDNEKKAEFVADTMQKILLSKSTKSCIIMGIIIQDITNRKSELTLEDLICLDALTNFFDADFENYKYIGDYLHAKNKKYFGLYLQFQNECKKDNMSLASLTLTVEKAVSHQLLKKEIDVELSIDSDDPSWSEAESNITYAMTSPGIKLYEYILLYSSL